MALNNVGEPTVDTVFLAVALQASPKQDALATTAITIANSSTGIIKSNDGNKSKKF